MPVVLTAPASQFWNLILPRVPSGGLSSMGGVVQNCGSEALDAVVVRDDPGTPAVPGDDVIVLGPLSLGPGSSALYSGSYTPKHSPSTDTVTATAMGTLSGLPATDQASATCEVPAPGGFQGCTPGYWKQEQHFDSWLPTGYVTNQSAGSVFSSLASACPALATTKLVKALGGGGGPAYCDKVQILLRAAVAAVLDAAHPAIAYPRTVQQIVDAVNAAVLSGSATRVGNLAKALDTDNNRGCPLN